MRKKNNFIAGFAFFIAGIFVLSFLLRWLDKFIFVPAELNNIYMAVFLVSIAAWFFFITIMPGIIGHNLVLKTGRIVCIMVCLAAFIMTFKTCSTIDKYSDEMSKAFRETIDTKGEVVPAITHNGSNKCVAYYRREDSSISDSSISETGDTVVDGQDNVGRGEYHSFSETFNYIPEYYRAEKPEDVRYIIIIDVIYKNVGRTRKGRAINEVEFAVSVINPYNYKVIEEKVFYGGTRPPDKEEIRLFIFHIMNKSEGLEYG
jgi:hypothetical protein